MKRLTATDIRLAVDVLRNGGVIAYPTETVYGLGCDPRNASTKQRIYELKGRDLKHPMLLVASSLAQVRKVARLEGTALQLAKTYWPGPLTLVLPARTIGTIAIRVSSSPIVQELCRTFGFPIVSTSANRSGEPECRSGRAITRIFDGHALTPDLVLDVGRLPQRKTSTIVQVDRDGRIDVLREGAIKL